MEVTWTQIHEQHPVFNDWFTLIYFLSFQKQIYLEWQGKSFLSVGVHETKDKEKNINTVGILEID